MKKYGIYLAYAPEQDIRNQGLGRLLAFVISGALDNNTPLVLAYPKWYEEEIKKLCEDQSIDFNKIEKIVTNSIPMVLRIKSMIEKYMKGKNKSTSLGIDFIKAITQFIGKMVIRWLGLANIFLFLFIGIFFAIFGILISPLLILIALMKIGLLFMYKLIHKPLIHKYINLFKSPLSSVRRNLFAHIVYERIRKQELQRLNQKINQKTDVTAWLIPTLFWPEIETIKAKKVVVAPDIILYDFPTQFNIPVFQRVNQNLIKTIAKADHFITYSTYVKTMHLEKPFGIDQSKISVIPHGALDLSIYLEKEDSLSIFRMYQKEKLNSNDYLANFDLENIHYIFYSSQIRPHKNFLNLIKAYKILLREKFVNVKLITTANFQYDLDVNSYITKHRLQNDILSFYNVPSKMLAALNARAICAVNPTLFEGGFPFTFLEAYTVGTPSIMGNIPMTLEYIHDEELKNIMLFDPFSVNDMVEKIEWGIKNHEKLFEIQHRLAEQMKQRTWSHVASDYIKVLEDVSNR